MTLVRTYLLAIGTFSVVIGLAYMFRPVEMATLADLALSSPTAVIEVQGFYGGQLVGLGVAILLGLWESKIRRGSSPSGSRAAGRHGGWPAVRCSGGGHVPARDRRGSSS